MIQMEEVVMSTTMIEHQALTTADRCDRCGAQAYVRITLRNGGELLFCAHHARAHETRGKLVCRLLLEKKNQILPWVSFSTFYVDILGLWAG